VLIGEGLCFRAGQQHLSGNGRASEWTVGKDDRRRKRKHDRFGMSETVTAPQNELVGRIIPADPTARLGVDT
jgi:hypothetical protein